MNFADQLKNAQSDKKRAEQERKERIWESMLDEVFEEIKTYCMSVAQNGATVAEIWLKKVY